MTSSYIYKQWSRIIMVCMTDHILDVECYVVLMIVSALERVRLGYEHTGRRRRTS